MSMGIRLKQKQYLTCCLEFERKGTFSLLEGICLDDKEYTCNAGTWVQSLAQEDTLGKEMATHSSILALKNPMDSGAWRATVHRVARVGHDLAIKPPP